MKWVYAEELDKLEAHYRRRKRRVEIITRCGEIFIVLIMLAFVLGPFLFLAGCAPSYNDDPGVQQAVMNLQPHQPCIGRIVCH